MIKEIKFRAWDKENRFMYPVQAIKFKEPMGGWLMINGEDYSGKDFELMQYTGLKDKNDKEIYEGDIGWNASDEGGETKVGNHEVVFENGAFRLKTKDGKVLGAIRGEIFEVIGNIYENKELIK